MKRFIPHCMKIMLIVLFIFLLIACEKAEPTESESSPEPSLELEEEGAESGPIHIGFSMDTLEEERWLKDRELFKKEVEELGAKIDIMVANEDVAKQIAQVETLIHNGVDVLVIVPYNTEPAAAIVEKAHLAGIKVISYDRLIKNANVDLYVSFDNEMVGELQAKAITSLVPTGKYVYIGGAITDNNANLIKKGVFKVLQPYIQNGDITVVYDQWTEDWNPDNAYKNMLAALEANHNKIDAVIAANDSTAEGAIRALREKGLAGKIPVAGQDADLTAVQRIVQGEQAMTVYKPISSLAKETADLALKLADGETIKTNRKINNGKIEVPSILLSPIEVNKDNIDDTIIADGFHSREDVYGE
ncbi:sugar ABC transporter substrate-binding protein [Ornithinibacillus bavariensis]|uniref:D-xylose ABC transporter substrate-binding protein n=1 Tax=Ornithinibacillus bavariensis TaxID=545502 RepID=A0A919X622_9BACI|nr:D-xylose ABC transporter substrate-binding protein [Ornithinibacillus bavariensis]